MLDAPDGGARRGLRVAEDLVDRISFDGAAVNLAMTAVLIVLLVSFDHHALALFLGGDSPAVPAAIHIQWLAIWSYLPFGITIVVFGTLRAYGEVWSPIFVLIASMYGVRLAVYALGYPMLGADAIWLSFPISSVFSTL